MLNLFATVLTYPAPTSNYRGESEENRTILQKISKGGKEYPVISPESIRNALREMLILQGLPHNRTRLHNEEQLAVEFKCYPNSELYADDFLFGYMVADKGAIEEAKKINNKFTAKRDSIFRMNMAVGLTPYRYNAIFHQSPLNAGKSPWKNAKTSALIHREVTHTAFQYPFALSSEDCKKGKEEGIKWAKGLLKAIGELNHVAGGHARSYYEMAPKSIVARLTNSLVAGYDTYGFNEEGHFPELKRIEQNDLPGSEFWIGGALYRDMSEKEKQKLTDLKVNVYENPQTLLKNLGDGLFKQPAEG